MQQKLASWPKVYFVRHGQSVANQEKILAGSAESSLTDKGIKQAHTEAATVLEQGIVLDGIITSPLSRALDTARIIARHIGFDEEAITVNDLFKERNVGGFEGKTHHEFKLASETDKEAAGCETLTDLYERVVHANEFIQSIAKENENILVVGHAAFYRMARCVADGLGPSEMYDIEDPKNSTLLEYPL